MTTKSSGTALKPYPICKESKNPWIGAVPEHWDVVPMSAVGKVKSVTGAPDLPLLSVYLRDGVILFSDAEERRTNPTSENLSNYQKVEPGDLVLNNQQAWRGSVGVSKYQGIVSPAYLVIALNNRLNQRFSDLLFRDRVMVDQYLVASKGVGSIQRNLYWPHYKRASALVPPLQEQAAIVRFLDHADEQIQRYIASKERLIALLGEERQALVHQAVTRGLDPNVRLKPSGVEWMGDVPEHWEVTRTRFLFKEIDRRSSTGNETHLSMSQVLGLVPSHQVEQTLISDSYVGGKLCEKGDLVLNRLKAHLGVFALADQKGVISPDYSVFRKRLALEMEYFTQVLRLPALRPELRIRSKGIVEGFWRLYTGDLFDIRLPVPPVAEQVTIVDNLSRMTGKLNAAIARTRRQIDLMTEYRTRLIADVVTGQLDVRKAAAQLPAAP